MLIITSVVPPELPMELSLAVTNSLTALSRASVYCTEPFRIAFAGAVDVCCFDKTGTLTRDELALSGIIPRSGSHFIENSGQGDLARNINDPGAILVLGCCHSLALLDDGTIIGDSLERAQFDGLRETWRLIATDVLQQRESSNNTKRTIRISKRFSFASELRRMSCVAVDERTKTSAWVVCKGAPEVLKPFLAAVPTTYDDSWRARAMRGERVLSLAYRRLQDWRKLQRPEAESMLEFCGFVCFTSPLKPGTRSAMSELLRSRHRCIVITGDGALTAVHVAREVGIVSKPVDPDILVADSDRGALWRSLARELDETALGDAFHSREVAQRAYQRDLVIRGDGLAALDSNDLRLVCRYALVYARVAPNQKEQVVAALNSAGSITLMCGDGTNDVGALKRAHVGVSIMNSPALEARLQHVLAAKPDALDAPTLLANVEIDAMDLDPTLVNLGDASIASPFSSKRATIDCVLAIIRQGRCTLVTMLQVFKILALMCLVSAYMLSSLHLHGVKQGDTQMTVVGLSTAVLFFLLSRAQPLERLASRRPPQRVFEAKPSISIVAQFVLHFSSLIAIMRLCRPFAPSRERSHVPDGAFSPSVINTAIFLFSAVVQVNIFATNYQGHPFMQSLRDHTLLWSVVLHVPL